jgi:hypothetical protein
MIKYVASFAVGFAAAAIIFSLMSAPAASATSSEASRDKIWKEFQAQEIPKARESAAAEARTEIQETAVNAGWAYFEDQADGKRTFRWLACKDH